MKLRALALLALLAAASAPHAAAAEGARSPWWDEAWHFRLPLTLDPAAEDPVGGAAVDLAGARDAVVLVPIDLTAAMHEAPWPKDAGGRPVGWTFLPDSVRVVPVDDSGRQAAAPLAARFLPFEAAALAPPFDPQSHASGTLALVVPGAFDAPRRVHLYFDIEENGAKPSPTPAPRLDEVANAGLGVRFLVRVPPAPAAATAELVLLAEKAGRATVMRLPAGAAPEEVATAELEPATAARVRLPSEALAYDLLVTADVPVLAALDASPVPARAAVIVPALDGAGAGTRFLVPSLRGAGARLELVGTDGRAEVTVQDASTGAPVARATVAQLGSWSGPLPDGDVWRISSTKPVLALLHGEARDGASAFLLQGAPLGGGASGSTVVAPRAVGHAMLGSGPSTARAFPLDAPGDALTGRIGDAPRVSWTSRSASTSASESWGFLSNGPPGSVVTGSDGLLVARGREGRAFSLPVLDDAPADAAKPPLEGALLLPYANSRVDAEIRAPNGTRIASAGGTVSLGGALQTMPDGTGTLVRGATLLAVTTSRPAFLQVWRPGAPAVSFLAGLPPLVEASAGPVEVQGPLLSWTTPALDVFAAPGETARVTLTLANRGRDPEGAPLRETVRLSLERAPDASCGETWDAALVESEVEVGSPEERDILVTVAVPAGSKAGCASFAVRAASAATNASTDARVTVRARGGFEPELRILDAEGAPVARRTVTADGTVLRLPLVLRNLRPTAGNATLAVSTSGDYEARVVRPDETEPVERVAVPGDGAVQLELELRARTAQPSPGEVFVEAASVDDPSRRSDVSALVTPASTMRIDAAAAARRVLLVPGGTGDANVTVTNRAGDVELRAALAGATRPGWNVSVSPERFLLRAGATIELRATVSAPASARVGETLPVTLLLESSVGGADAARVGFSALVVNDLLLDLDAPPAIAAAPASDGTVAARLISRAAGPLNVAVRSVGAPTGWSAHVALSADALRPGEAATLTLRYMVEPGAPAGTGSVRVELETSDSVTPSRNLTLVIPATTFEQAVLRIDGVPLAVDMPRDGAAVIVGTLVNDGNLATDVRVDADGAEVVAGAIGRLEPGASRLVRILVSSPGDVRIEARGEGTAVTATSSARALARDLVVESVQLGRSAAGTLVANVTIANRGGDVVPGVRLTAVAAERVVANFTLPALAVGAAVSHLVALPEVTSVRFTAAGVDGAPDAQPADDAAQATLDAPLLEAGPGGIGAAVRATPAGGIVAILAIALAAWRSRR